MPTPPSDDPSLIHDAQFLEELERCEGVSGPAASRQPARRTRYSDAFDALESGLPMDAGAPAPEPVAARREGAPRKESAPSPVARRVSSDARIPFATAAVVLAGCLAIGGATAALVFHTRVMQITASWASR